eukprot:6177789-Ditylum_brightwellii.AAC.1
MAVSSCTEECAAKASAYCDMDAEPCWWQQNDFLDGWECKEALVGLRIGICCLIRLGQRCTVIQRSDAIFFGCKSVVRCQGIELPHYFVVACGGKSEGWLGLPCLLLFWKDSNTMGHSQYSPLVLTGGSQSVTLVAGVGRDEEGKSRDGCKF